MTPYYSDQGVTIYHGDCIGVLGQLREPAFDLLLTDPPYGQADKWSGGTWAANAIYDEAAQWDILQPEAVSLALALCEKAIVWGGNHYALKPSRSWLAWVKTPILATMADFELAWTNLDKPSKAIRIFRNPDGKREHPTQKPEALMRWSILQTEDTVRSVLDPFMGSGTTLVAAKAFGLTVVGIEREERYCEIAAKRLSQGVLTGMFQDDDVKALDAPLE